MEFLDWLYKLPGRALATVLGLFFFPLRALYNTVKYSLIALFLLALVVGVVYNLIYTFLQGSNFSVFANVLIQIFVVTPIVLVLSTLAIAAGALVMTGVLLYEAGRGLWLGVKAGVTKGMEGFWEEYAEDGFWARLIAAMPFDFDHPIAHEEELDFDNYQRILDMLFQEYMPADSPADVASLEVANQTIQAKLLSDKEIKDAQLELGKSPNPELQSALEAYQSLQYRLTKLKLKLGQDDCEIEDELIQHLDVTTPIFFVKEYEETQADGTKAWRMVPGTGYIADKENLLAWFKTKAHHPVNNDKIKDPSPYNGKPTRYQWQILSGNCHVTELEQLTSDVRRLMPKAAPVASLSSSADVFFQKPAAADASTSANPALSASY